MPAQMHGNTRLEIGWTIAPALVLAVVMVPTVAMIWELDVRDPDAMQVTVKGYQWWWGFEYADEDMTTSYGDQDPIMTADVLVIPEDTPVELTIVSDGGGGARRRRRARLRGDPLVLGAAAVRQAGRDPDEGEPHRVLGRRAGHLLGPVRGVLRPAARRR